MRLTAGVEMEYRKTKNWRGGKQNKAFHERRREVYLDEERKLLLWSTFGLTPRLGLGSSPKGSFVSQPYHISVATKVNTYIKSE